MITHSILAGYSRKSMVSVRHSIEKIWKDLPKNEKNSLTTRSCRNCGRKHTSTICPSALDATAGWVLAVGNPNPAAMEADTLYVGFWTDKGKADESSSDFLKQLRGKQVFLFGTAGFGGSEEYFNKILKTVQKDLHSSNTVIGSFMCQGKMPMSVRQRYENMKKQPLHLPNLDAMIENFDKALSHPDADDLERLKQAVR